MFFSGTCKDGAWRTENPLLRCDLPLRLLTSARTACGADSQDIQPEISQFIPHAPVAMLLLAHAISIYVLPGNLAISQ
jgi:hypothetical protein